jgi:acetylornithine deacetylase
MLKCLEWIERLVRIDTTSRNSNLGLIEEVRDYLEGFGIKSRLTYDSSRGKANLFATVPGRGGRMDGGTVLSGHTDVVPTDGQEWETDPFKPVVKNGRLFGRGTCDMKGFIGAALGLIPELSRHDLRAPVHVALSYDEEVGCLGAPRMIEDFLKAGVKPSACVVGEPTNMAAVIGHKGINIYRCKVRGSAAHSSLTPHAVNAIDAAAEMIRFIRGVGNRLAENGPRDPAFDVPFTTISTNLVSGGSAANIIPAACEFVFEFRQLPGADAAAMYSDIEGYARDQLVPKLRERFSGADIAFERLACVPAFETSAEAPLSIRVKGLVASEACKKVAYATEAGQFQGAGVPSIVCGPGNIEQAHRANEFVSLEQLAECESFLRKLLLEAG